MLPGFQAQDTTANWQPYMHFQHYRQTVTSYHGKHGRIRIDLPDVRRFFSYAALYHAFRVGQVAFFSRFITTTAFQEAD
jgi:hypothetical protein